MSTDGFLLGLCGINLPRWSLSVDMLTRIWIWILRVASIIPLIYVAITARGYRQSIKELPDATNTIEAQKRKEIDQALYMIFATCAAVVCWTPICSVFMLMYQSGWIVFHGVFDIFPAFPLAIGYHALRGSVPLPMSDCENLDDNFSKIMVILGKNGLTAQQECQREVIGLKILFLVVVLQFTIAYLGTTFMPWDRRDLVRFGPLHFILLLGYLILKPPYRAICYLDQFCGSHLYMATQRAIVFWRHLRMKPLGRPSYPKPQRPFPAYDVPATKLMNVLVLEEAVLKIVEDMCWSDIVNFSLACKAVREQVFPPGDLEWRVPKLEKSSRCFRTPRSKCLYCGIVVCLYCGYDMFLSSLAIVSHGRHHANNCRPLCGDCYKVRERDDALSQSECDCKSRQPGYWKQYVCKLCCMRLRNEHYAPPGTLTETPLKDLKYMRFMQKASNVAFGAGLGAEESLRCGECDKTLDSRFVWWHCGNCGKTCDDQIHPRYLGSKKNRRLRRIEMDTEREE